MKPAALLPIASVLSILLLTLHVTDDIVRGISQAESSIADSTPSRRMRRLFGVRRKILSS